VYSRRHKPTYFNNINHGNRHLTPVSIVIITLGLLISIFSPCVRADRLLTLSEAVTLAVANDPEVKNAKRSIHLGQTKRSQARQGYLPKLEIGLTNSPQLNYYGQPVINNLLWNSYIGVEQPLYAGGTIKNAVRLAESETRRQESEYTIYRQNVSAEATKSYYQTLSAQGTVDQYASLLRQGEEDVREAQTRLQAGTSSRMEVLETSSRLLDVQQKVSKARADHQVAVAELKKVLGLEGDDPLRLADAMPIPDIRTDFDTLLHEAHGNRPQLKYIAEDVTYNQIKTNIEKGKQRPQLSLVAYHQWQSPVVFESNRNFSILLKASYSWENSTLSFQESRNQIYPNAYAYPNYPGNPPLATYYFPVRTLKYSLFDKSSNKVDLEKSRSDRDLAQDRWHQEQKTLATELKTTLAQKQDSLSRMDLSKKQIVMSEQLVDIHRTKYRTGLATAADVLKARAALVEARVNLLNAQKDFAVSLAQLYRILGRDLLAPEDSSCHVVGSGR
jgi:outer membrane protein